MADRKPDEYQNVSFYAKHTKAKDNGFSKFVVDKDFYFCRYIDGEIAMLSQAYTSAAGRDNGIESVKKNEKITKRFKFEGRASGRHGFSLRAGNGQEIAISPDYASLARAETVTGRMSGRLKRKSPAKKVSSKSTAKKSVTRSKATATAKPKTAKRSSEQNYQPIAFYRKATKGKKQGFESFKGSDGEYYFTYFENSKIALISEGYPTAAIRDTGLASVKKNMKLRNRYVYGKGADGKDGFILRAGNHKEIARSVAYGSAAAATTGAAYLIGTRRRATVKKAARAKPVTRTRARTAVAKPKPVRKKTVKAKATAVKAKAPTVKAAPKPKPKPKPVKRKTRVVKPLAAGAVAVAGLAASAKPKTVKKKTVKQKAVPVRAAAAPKPKAKPKTVKKKTKIVKPLVAGSVVAAGLGASAARAKASPVKKKAVPVKAPPMKPAPALKTAKPAAPVKAAAIGTAAAAVAGASAMAAKPKEKVVKSAPVEPAPVKPAPVKPAPVKVAPVAAPPVVAAKAATVAAAAPAAAVAAKTGGGIWGWLKWILMALLALLAMFFLFKACAGGEKTVRTVPPVSTTTSPTAAIVTCWNGTKAQSEGACPAKITCWDNSFVTQQSACPAQPVAKDFECWDGSLAVDEASCPAKPVAKAPVVKTPVVAAPVINTFDSGRICGTSAQTLFNVTSSSPKSVSYLGSNPQFGNSLSLTPDGFYRKLSAAYQAGGSDRAFLNLLARSLGYGSFRDMDASMFSNDTLPKGSAGLLGFGSNHALQFSALDVTDSTHLEAFKVRSANGTDVHFMKRCGNFMYVCQP